MQHIDTRFFRAGVGTVIYNQVGEVALFKRVQNPVGIWQFQQGGIDLGEQPEETLWRELKEEIGLTRADFTAIHEYPEWTVHQYEHTIHDASKSRLGQAHRWYFLALDQAVTIDLSQATEHEASDWRFVTFAAAIAGTEAAKQPVYQALAEYFSTHILPTLRSAPVIPRV